MLNWLGNQIGNRGDTGQGGRGAWRGPEHLGICARTLTDATPVPGPCRQTGLGMGSTMARVGSIVSPLVSMTSELYSSLPLFIYGAVPVAASTATALLPETLGQPLPDTVQDIESR